MDPGGARRPISEALSIIAGAVAVTALVGIWTVGKLSAERPAKIILRSVLAQPTEDAVTRGALALRPNESQLVIDDDLVKVTAPADQARSNPTRVAHTATRARADELYADGLPSDPGSTRTPTGLPRDLLDQLSEHQHDRHQTAQLVAVIAVGAILLVGATLVSTASVGWVLAAALVAGWVLARLQLLVVTTMVEDATPSSSAVSRTITDAASQALRTVQLLAIVAIVAAWVYRRVLRLFEQRSAAAGTGAEASPT